MRKKFVKERDFIMIKEVIIALSFANICLVEIWCTFFYRNLYLHKYLPGINSYLALMIAELILALIFWFGYKLVRRLNNLFVLKAVKVFFCLLVLRFLFVVGVQFGKIDSSILRILLVVLIIILLLQKKAIKSVVTIVLIMVPFVVVIFGQSIFAIIEGPKDNRLSQAKKTLPSIIQKAPSPRVVWIIFDQLDKRVAFVDRPNSIKLPEFDHLCREAFFAKNAYPPAYHTEKSLPALLTGKIVEETSISSINELMIQYKGTTEKVKWSDQSTIFTKARDLQTNTALLGWFHPYPRIIGDQLVFCWWSSLRPNLISDNDNVFGNIGVQLKNAFLSTMCNYENHKNNHRTMLEFAKEKVIDSQFGLVFIHFPVPHGPYIHNRPWWYSNPGGYLGNLELADQTLGEIRRVMEREQVWDDTTVLVTADHWWRKSKRFDKKTDYRIPFILKLPGQTQTAFYEPSFNTVMTHDLILAILRKEVSTPENLVKWLNEHRIDEGPVLRRDKDDNS